ncbi:piggyBac transposable element-derived protein 4-like [Plutella xylostella]|uniref:piggyBac transposable element-derived protein 4-like n=1 Tax=Plutella xylostella TaxID=51655 RepID=UPI002032B8F1|nr:piggyBac transposable element-derived protein 4-like [Plutella xylostella]
MMDHYRDPYQGEDYYDLLLDDQDSDQGLSEDEAQDYNSQLKDEDLPTFLVDVKVEDIEERWVCPSNENFNRNFQAESSPCSESSRSPPWLPRIDYNQLFSQTEYSCKQNEESWVVFSRESSGGAVRASGGARDICLKDEDIPETLTQMVQNIAMTRQTSDQVPQPSNEQEITSQTSNTTSECNECNNEFYDSDRAEYHFMNSDKSAFNFEWSDISTFNQIREPFLATAGVQLKLSTPYEAFRHYWSDDILQHIATATNTHALAIASASEKFKTDWRDTNADEIMILFAFWIMLGIIRMPSIKSCFSNSALLKTNIFSTLMTENRYWLLNKALYFVTEVGDNPTRPINPPTLYLKPVIDHLNKKFKEAYSPGPDLTVNETSICRNLQSKTSNSIKYYELVECGTGYLLSVLSDDSIIEPVWLSRHASAVVQLTRPLLHRGHRLFLDERFSSPPLARLLKRNNTDCVGVLSSSRDLPSDLHSSCLVPGDCSARHAGDVAVWAYRDRQHTLYAVSTHHGAATAPRLLPSVVKDLHTFLSPTEHNSVDPCVDRTQTWQKRMFKRLLNATVLNSSILIGSTGCKKQTAFSLGLVEEIMKRHLGSARGRRRAVQTGFESSEARLVERHFIARAPCGGGGGGRLTGADGSSRGRRACVWCAGREGRSRKTVYVCEQCQVPLCLNECFKKFHTVP